MNRTTRHIVAHGRPKSDRNEKHTYMHILQSLKSKKSCKIDLFNRTLKPCEVNSVGKR